MTAERGPDVRSATAAVADPTLRVDLFLLGGQFPGADHGQTLRALVTYAEAAEDAGFDGVWLAEHHFISYGICPSAVALAAYLLGRTRRLRVGTAAAILSNRHPVALAEEVTLIDAVADGRFDLGVARGGPWVDLEVFGTGLDRYTAGFPESLDLLLSALSGQPSVAADGPRFKFRDVAVVPRPTGPRPVWVAATSTSTVDVAARRGLPLLLGMHEADAAKAAAVAAHTRAARPGPGTAMPAHASAHLAFVDDTVQAAEAVLRAALPRWLAATKQYVRIDGGPPAHRDLDAYVETLLAIHPVGPPERCVRRLWATLHTTGVRRLLLMVEAGGTPGRTKRNIDRLGAEVLPQLRAMWARAGRLRTGFSQ